MWIRTMDGVLVNLDYYERVAANESGTFAYRTIDYTKRVERQISHHNDVDRIGAALRDGKKYLDMEDFY